MKQLWLIPILFSAQPSFGEVLICRPDDGNSPVYRADNADTDAPRLTVQFQNGQAAVDIRCASTSPMAIFECEQVDQDKDLIRYFEFIQQQGISDRYLVQITFVQRRSVPGSEMLYKVRSSGLEPYTCGKE